MTDKFSASKFAAEGAERHARSAESWRGIDDDTADMEAENAKFEADNAEQLRKMGQ